MRSMVEGASPRRKFPVVRGASPSTTGFAGGPLPPLTRGRKA